MLLVVRVVRVDRLPMALLVALVAAAHSGLMLRPSAVVLAISECLLQRAVAVLVAVVFKGEELLGRLAPTEAMAALRNLMLLLHSHTA